MKMRNVADMYRLSPTQQGMLFHTLYEPESGMYIEQMGMTPEEALDVADFRRAWEQVIARHPSLRTAFLWEGGEEPVQVVREQVTTPWEEIEWPELPAAAADARLQEWLRADRVRGFKLAHAPLMRLTLIRVAPATMHIIWTYHHLILDGSATNQVLAEVFAYYRALRAGETLALPQPRPYKEYIAWLQGQDSAAAEHYWRTQLAGFSAATPLTVDLLAPGDTDSTATEELETRLTQAETQNIQAFARANQLTVNTIVQGAWALLLSRYSGEADVIHGVTASTRPPTLPGVESMVGLFINTLPLRLRVAPQDTTLSWLRQVQAALVDMQQYDFSSLVDVQGWSAVPRGQPLFESIVVFENYGGGSAEEGAASEPRLTTWWGEERATFPLTLTVGQGPEMLLRVGFEAKRFDQATIVRLAGHLRLLLLGMVAVPERLVRDIPLLTDAERTQVVETWNTPALTPPVDPRTIGEVIRDHARTTPLALAVQDDATTLTYHAFVSRATALAAALQQHHALRPGSRLGLALPRSADFALAFLAGLFAGATLVPLDPTYPHDRLAFLCADADITLILTHPTLRDALAPLGVPLLALADLPPTDAPVAFPLLTPDHLAYLIYT
ncbi:MAG: AMP-binding protein, partial [Ktedonobacterales bacterium]|nr:AMP-binding protein [Ktedonobacterales bacterium]